MNTLFSEIRSDWWQKLVIDPSDSFVSEWILVQSFNQDNGKQLEFSTTLFRLNFAFRLKTNIALSPHKVNTQ
jgi:hypothetical protein